MVVRLGRTSRSSSNLASWRLGVKSSRDRTMGRRNGEPQGVGGGVGSADPFHCDGPGASWSMEAANAGRPPRLWWADPTPPPTPCGGLRALLGATNARFLRRADLVGKEPDVERTGWLVLFDVLTLELVALHEVALSTAEPALPLEPDHH